MLLTTIIAVT